jgi:toxin YoeB
MSFHVEFTQRSELDINKHKKIGNKAILKKLLVLLEELTQHP